MVLDKTGVRRFQLQRSMSAGITRDRKTTSGKIELSPKTKTEKRFDQAVTEIMKRADAPKKPKKKLRTYLLDGSWRAEGKFRGVAYEGRGVTERQAIEDWMSWAKSLQGVKL